MLHYKKVPPHVARKAWPKIIPQTVACETRFRELSKAGVLGIPSLDIHGQRIVRCLYNPASNTVLGDRGIHIEGVIGDANGAGGIPSPFPGFFLIKVPRSR